MVPPSLQVAAARYALGLASGEELSQVADALLTQGIYSYSLGELGTVSHPTLRDVGPLFVAALRELGVEVPSRERAVFTLMKESILNIAEGAEAPSQGIHRPIKELWHLFGPDALALRSVADSLGSHQLRVWVGEYREIEELAGAGYLDAAEREERLAALDREVTEFAQAWLREHCPLQIEPAWLAWREGAIRKLAEAIHDGRRFGDLPILADALEEAGCSDPEILTHCRMPRVHGNGCWVVDAVLGTR